MGDVIEVCPVIVCPLVEVEGLTLDPYSFLWGDDAAIVLGYGSLYNHSYEPNAVYNREYDRKEIRFIAIRPLPAGAEITINYNGDPTSREPLWFEVQD